MKRALTITLVMTISLSLVAPPAYAQVPVAALTIATLLSSLRSLVQQLESSARSLLEQGNNAAAQQQFLLANTITALIRQTETSYSSALNKTSDKLTIAESNVFQNLQSILTNTKGLEHKTIADIQQTVYQTQVAANQILDKLPLVDRRPFFYGMLTRDLLVQVDQQPADIEILGYLLADPKLNFEKPLVRINNIAIPAARISVSQDRALIQLPDALRQQLRLMNLACDPMKTFHITLDSTYLASKTLLWIIPTTGHATASFSGNALPTSRRYDVIGSVDGIQTTTTLPAANFSLDGAYTSVSCEESRSSLVTWNGPADAVEITPSAQWVATDNLKSQSASAVPTGTGASASGTITGLDKHFGNCPGGGHGTLRLSGTYKHPVAQTTSISLALNGSVIGTGSVHLTIPATAGVHVNTVTVKVRRHNCDRDFDQITINAPADANQQVQQTSAQGRFRATLLMGQLIIDNIQE